MAGGAWTRAGAVETVSDQVQTNVRGRAWEFSGVFNVRHKGEGKVKDDSKDFLHEQLKKLRGFINWNGDYWAGGRAGERGNPGLGFGSVQLVMCNTRGPLRGTWGSGEESGLEI